MPELFTWLTSYEHLIVDNFMKYFDIYVIYFCYYRINTYLCSAIKQQNLIHKVMKQFKSGLTNSISEVFKCYHIPSYLLNAIDNNCFDKRDEKILDLIISIAETFYNHGISDGLSKTDLNIEQRNKIRNSIKLELNK